VTESAARAIAKSVHDGQQTSAGGSQFDHVRRVSAVVPERARVTAWLHDVLERTSVTIDQLRVQGMSPAELSALALLTRTEKDDYRAYVQRIADAPGQAGALARVVKLADLEDHLVYPRRHAIDAALRVGSARDPARSRRRVRFRGKSRLRDLKRLAGVSVITSGLDRPHREPIPQAAQYLHEV
jgi:hypothetical protein